MRLKRRREIYSRLLVEPHACECHSQFNFAAIPGSHPLLVCYDNIRPCFSFFTRALLQTRQNAVTRIGHELVDSFHLPKCSYYIRWLVEAYTDYGNYQTPRVVIDKQVEKLKYKE